MSFVHIVTYNNTDPQAYISELDYQDITALVSTTPGLRQVNLHLPSSARDYYTDDGHSPQLVIESYFDDLLTLEHNLTNNGHLQTLANTKYSSLQTSHIEHQVMFSRTYPVRNETTVDNSSCCSYLVHYPGFAENFFEWLNYYLAHHPQIMQRFPSIRAIEIYTRVDWVDSLPWRRANYMQRNKQVFDSPEHLTAALNSPIRHEMRTDFEKFPTFHGGNLHFAMKTYQICPY
ncbi:MAG TPA: hypothetical protein VFD12_07075 [Oligella sp.]|nr:hypothetical protein [Oligella sp.]